jgi:uncharacterized membrane protein YebE (DUF533 family)
MLIKIAALGALGYAGYRYFTSQQGKTQTYTAGDNLVAGGPLTSSATVQHSQERPSL